MAKTPGAGVKLSHEFEVAVPAPEKAIMVPESQWNLLIDRIERCRGHSSLFEIVGSISAGVAGTAFFTYLPLAASAEPTASRTAAWCVVAAIVAALFALACFGFCWLYHGTVVDVRQLVIDDMRRLSATQIRERAYVPALDARGQSGLPN